MALSDNADNPAFVETLPRLGYRFIAPLDRSDEYTGSMSKARRRIGVLPIEDLGKAVEDYFALGLTEDLISALSRVDSEKLRVVTGPRFRRDSAIEADLEQIQRDLNLDYLLRGWVLHDLHDKSVFGRRYMTALPLIYPYCRRRSHGESVNRLPSNCCLRPPLVRGNTLARQQSTICTPKYFRGCTLDSGVVSG